MIRTYQSGQAVIRVKIDGTKVFCSTLHGGLDNFIDFAFLFDKQSLLREFPDLRGQPDEVIYKEGGKRWYAKLEAFKEEEEIWEYIEDELAGKGFIFIEEVSG